MELFDQLIPLELNNEIRRNRFMSEINFLSFCGFFANIQIFPIVQGSNQIEHPSTSST